MKKLIMSLVCITTLFLSSCDTETTGNVSRVTIFPEISANGDAVMFSELGQPFTDPGANATVAGAPVDFETSSNIDINTPGFYSVNYSVENEDGFAATAFRTVIVYENNGTVAGVYWGRRTTRGIASPILVSTRTDGDFDCTDILGGYYEQSTNNYGPAYGADAIIMVDIPGGTVTSPGSVIGFGPVSMSGGTISADGRTMNWTGTLDAYAFGFPVELVKITP